MQINFHKSEREKHLPSGPYEDAQHRLPLFSAIEWLSQYYKSELMHPFTDNT